MNKSLDLKTISLETSILKHINESNKMIINICSAKLESQRAILKGEKNNPDSKIRNAYVRIFGFEQTTPKAFLNTSNSHSINSIHVIKYKKEEYILVSGNSCFLEIFQYDSSDSSKRYIGKFKFLCI